MISNVTMMILFLLRESSRVGGKSLVSLSRCHSLNEYEICKQTREKLFDQVPRSLIKVNGDVFII